jgi:hypothetical protein
MRLMAKNYPFIHKPYTLCLLCVLRGEFLQWTQLLYWSVMRKSVQLHCPKYPHMWVKKVLNSPYADLSKIGV